MEELNLTVQGDALKWLLEMEAINDPNVLNSLLLNVHRLSDRIEDVEFVTDSNSKRLLVYLDVNLGYWKKEQRSKRIQDLVENMLNDALPSYTKRIVFDRDILEKALTLVSNRT